MCKEGGVGREDGEGWEGGFSAEEDGGEDKRGKEEEGAGGGEGDGFGGGRVVFFWLVVVECVGGCIVDGIDELGVVCQT